MDSERCRVIREGLLDIKFPPNSPERILQKAWRKAWVRAIVLYPVRRGEPHLILKLSKSSEEKRCQVVKASRDGLRLFRCQSGSRPLRTWALSSGSSLLVYLAAENEHETQEWMQEIRNGLWPPILNTTGNTHNVSLIEDEKSLSSGILGLYGRLVKTTDDTVSIIHPHWQGTLLRFKDEDVINVCLVRKTEEESSAGVFKIIFRCSNPKERILYFYSDTATSVISWFKSETIEAPETGKTLDSTKEAAIKQQFLNEFSTTSLNTDSSEYGSIKKIEKQSEKNFTNLNEFGEKQDHLLEHNERDKLVNLPADFLDASISSVRFPIIHSKGSNNEIQNSLQGNSDDSDIEDVSYDHIYEDMIERTGSFGSHTLYEEIDDTENEYVPPLPPELPHRQLQKPNSLRLLKLSESVAEALKFAGDSPIAATKEHIGILDKVVMKKSKSLQASPLTEKPLENLKVKLELKRTTSAPSIINNKNRFPAESNLTSKFTVSIKSSTNSECNTLESCSTVDKTLSENNNVKLKLGSNFTGEQFSDAEIHSINKEKFSGNALIIKQNLDSEYLDMR